MMVELDGEQRAYIVRLLKKESEHLGNVANLMIKEKDSKIDDYEYTIQILKYTNELITTLND